MQCPNCKIEYQSSLHVHVDIEIVFTVMCNTCIIEDLQQSFVYMTMSVCVCVFVCACAHVCVFVCVHVHMCVCMCVSLSTGTILVGRQSKC